MNGLSMLDGRVMFWNITHELTLQKVIERIISTVPLPENPDTRFLLKPNLNNDLTGLTGNSTDLRVLREVIRALQARGYAELIVADGPNLGMARTGADVLRRLGIAALCESLGVECLDANQLEGRKIILGNGIKTRIPSIFFDADYIINLPTIKTHAETGMSCCMKNLVGVNIGKYKREIHRDLKGSVIALNSLLKVHLNIVDGLIAMEGDGPGNGVPRMLNWIVSGEDPFLTDCAVAGMIGLDPFEDVPCLTEALRMGLIKAPDADKIQQTDSIVKILRPNPVMKITRIFGHRSLGRIRDIIRPLFDNSLIRPLLHQAGVVQDIYEAEEADVKFQFAEGVSCQDCSLCHFYCPMQLTADDALDQSKGCIQCGYCYWVCNKGAIRLIGKKGYLARHVERYKLSVEKAVNCYRLPDK
ncbi:MAG: DUF362 domain-containing protein [Desulfobacterales bacterium]|nr:DUF362 domain-containing protein [Desulfobacterales bacterium]